VVKTGKAPKGFYTATQVMRKLGIASSTLYHLADMGKITRVVPPNKKEGYYLQDEVDKMVRERELFILTYAKDTSTFNRATEEDIQGIYDVTASLWNRNPSYEERLARYHQNPYIYYVVKKEGIVVGFLGLTPFKQEMLDALMSESYQPISGVAETILPFVPGQPIDNLFLDIGIRKGVPKSEAYGLRLIRGGLEVLETFAKQGSMVRNLYAASSTPDGIKLCREIGFTEIPSQTESSRKRFELNLEKSQSPFLKEYQKIIEESKREVDKE